MPTLMMDDMPEWIKIACAIQLEFEFVYPGQAQQLDLPEAEYAPGTR